VVSLLELYVGGLLSFRFTLVFIVFSIVKKLEHMNTLTSYVWWVFEFNWVVVGLPSAFGQKNNWQKMGCKIAPKKRGGAKLLN